MDGTENSRYLENETPSFITSIIDAAITFMENYGWFILIGTILAVYFYTKYKPTIVKMKQQHEDWKEQEMNKKDPDKSHQIQISMEQARLKLQEQVNIDSEKRKEIQLQRDEEHRRRKIEEWENHKQGKGYYSKSRAVVDDTEQNEGSNPPKPKKKTTVKRSEFNALSGSGGGSCSYRPSGRGRNTGGG